jgi:NAD(P) transhydrogenase subunit beta
VDIQSLIPLMYLVASVLFIFGLKKMGHPRTAVQGNLLGALGMLLAIGAALFDVNMQALAAGFGVDTTHYVLIAIGIVVGSVIGAVMAQRVQMTAMPQMVALFNGLGGAASVLVAGGAMAQDATPTITELVATAASAIIGAVTFWGSLVAYGKLQELTWFKRPYPVPAGQVVNALLALLTLAASAWLVAENALPAYIVTALLASVLGVLLVNPIGGADMPVVIALLNSYSGLAASATGFAIENNVLIISGALVGASGIILTQLMCRAMNRSLTHVLFGVMDAGGASASTDEVYATVRSTTPDDVAMILDGAQRVVIVPGYGLAVAQAQHAVRTLQRVLEDRGCTVEYAIHPVAGRMPGHMNVLLAEADVPYEQLKEMDEINPTMSNVDVAIVIGANDVVNPVARTDPKSPIAGMPIIDVDKAKTVIVLKRSLSPGFAGIPNPLFAAPNTLMLFADGQKGVLELNAAIREASK